MSNQEIFSQQGAGLVPEVANCLQTTCDDYSRADGFNMIAHSLRAEGFDASEDGTGRGTPIVPTLTHEVVGTLCAEDSPHGARGLTGLQTMLSGYIQPVAVAFERRMVRTSGGQPQEELTHCLRSDANTGDGAPCVAFSAGNSNEARGIGYTVEGTPPLRSGASGTNQVPTLQKGMQVRRLTPRECERLQGFPDDHTLIPWRGKTAPDGPRYKALGNSMAVPVMRWIGERIQSLDKQINEAGNE